jgi:hypothetical protein
MRIALQIKRLFLERFGEVPPIFRIVVFDTDDERGAEKLTRVDGGVVSLDEDREFFHIRVPIAGIERIYKRKKNIQSWFPYDELAAIARQVKNIDAGTPQKVRKVGRLAYFEDYGRVHAQIRDAWDWVSDAKVLASARDNGYEISDKGVEVDFYLGSSLCGGTGSGMVLDLASHVRALGEAADKPVQLHAYLFLPGAFSLNADEQRMVKANAYAALKEIDWIMSQPNYELDDPGGGRVKVGGKPFPRCFLVDGEQQAGPTLRDVNELSKVVAEAIFLSVCNPIGEKAETWFQAGANYLDREIAGRFSAYSSVGVASQFVPREELLAYSINRLATEVVDRLLDPMQIRKQESALEKQQLEQRRDVEINEAVRSLLNAHKPEVYLGGLSQAAFGLEVTPGGIGKTPRDGLRARLLTLRTNRENALLPDARAKIGKSARDLAMDFGGAVEAACEYHADNPEEGPNFVVAFLQRLQDSLDETSKEVLKRAEGLETQSNALKRKVDIEDKRFGDTANSILRYHVFGRASRFRGPANWSKALNDYVDNQLNISKLQAVQKIIDTVRGTPTTFEGVTTARHLQERYATLCSDLGDMRVEFESATRNAYENLERRQTIFEQSLIQPREMEKLYAGKAPPAGEVLDKLAKRAGPAKVHQWPAEYSDNVKRMLKEHCATSFGDFRELSLEDGIELKDIEARSVYDALQNASNPWLSYREAELTTDGLPGQQKILGVGDKGRSELIKEKKEGVQSAEIRDTSQAIFCQLEHGFTIRSLSHIDDYRKAYVDELDPRHGSKIRSLHIDPSFEFWRDPDKEEDLIDHVVAGLATGVLRFQLVPSGKWALLCADGEEGLVLGQHEDKEHALMDALRRLRGDENACQIVRKAVGTPSLGASELPKIQELISSNDGDPGPAMREILTRLELFVKKLGQARARSYVDEPS